MMVVAPLRWKDRGPSVPLCSLHWEQLYNQLSSAWHWSVPISPTQSARPTPNKKQPVNSWSHLMTDAACLQDFMYNIEASSQETNGYIAHSEEHSSSNLQDGSYWPIFVFVCHNHFFPAILGILTCPHTHPPMSLANWTTCWVMNSYVIFAKIVHHCIWI